MNHVTAALVGGLFDEGGFCRLGASGAVRHGGRCGVCGLLPDAVGRVLLLCTTTGSLP